MVIMMMMIIMMMMTWWHALFGDDDDEEEEEDEEDDSYEFCNDWYIWPNCKNSPTWKYLQLGAILRVITDYPNPVPIISQFCYDVRSWSNSSRIIHYIPINIHINITLVSISWWLFPAINLHYIPIIPFTPHWYPWISPNIAPILLLNHPLTTLFLYHKS